MASSLARLARDKIFIYYASMAWFLALFVGYFYLHELAGHYLANLMAGVTPAHLSVQWVRLAALPVFPSSVSLLAGEPTFFSKLAGGLVAGLVLLGMSYAWRRWYQRTGLSVLWWLYIITVGFALAGLLEGFMEGFFTEYHRQSAELLAVIILTFFMPPVAGLWHFRATLLGTFRKQVEQDESS